MKYRDNDYFNENDTYLFKTSTGNTFESKVENLKGSLVTVENMKYKVTTLPCVKVEK